MITYSKLRVLRIAESHYDEEIGVVPVDIIRQLWRSTPAHDARSEQSFTMVVDLTHNPEALLGKMHRNVRYSIRRAEKDDLSYEFCPGDAPQALTRFRDFHDAFARSKRVPRADRERLNALAQTGALDLSCVRDHAGRVLVWHAHYRTSDRGRLILSASLRRPTADTPLNALVGRANCFQTWHDILRFQRQGSTEYDFGGWYAGSEDVDKLGINRFKASFGGEVVPEFNSEVAITTAGRLALALKTKIGHYRRWTRSLRPPGDPPVKPELHMRLNRSGRN